MMRKILWLAALIILSAIPAAAQQSTYGDITASASTCAGNFNSSACVRLPMPANQATVSVTVLGTFTATLAVERSANHGGSWVSAGGNITSTGTSTYAVAGYTDFRVRASAYTSGSAKITITSSSAASGNITSGSGAPSGSCGVEDLYVDTATGSLYDCLAGVWTIISGGSGFWNTLTGVDGSGTTGLLATITSGADGDVITRLTGNWVNSYVGITTRADDDGTVALVTGDKDAVVTAAHAVANAVSIAQAGSAGLPLKWTTNFCTYGAGLSTITPTTSTIWNGLTDAATLTLGKGDCATIFVSSVAGNGKYFSVIKRAVPTRTTGTTNFLREDYTFAAPPGGTSFDPTDATVAWWRDDFGVAHCTSSGNLSQMGWSFNAIAGSNTANCLDGVYPNLGLLRMTTGATTGNGAEIIVPSDSLPPLGDLGGNTNWTEVWTFRINSTANIRFRAGFKDSQSTITGANAFIFRYDTEAGFGDAAFKLCIRSGSSDTCHATTYTADTAFHTVKISSTAAGTIVLQLDANASVCFNSGGTGGCTASTISTANMYPFVSCLTNTTAAKTCDIDLFAFKATGLSR